MRDQISTAAGNDHATWQKKGYMDEPTMLWWLDNVMGPYKVGKHGDSPILLLLDRFSAHVQPSVRACAHGWGILLWFGEPFTTGRWQPVDAGAGQQWKGFMAKAFEEELQVDDKLMTWSSGKVSTQGKRLMTLVCGGRASDAFFADDNEFSRVGFFTRTGCLITQDGMWDENIHIEAHPNYRPLPPGHPIPADWAGDQPDEASSSSSGSSSSNSSSSSSAAGTDIDGE